MTSKRSNRCIVMRYHSPFGGCKLNVRYGSKADIRLARQTHKERARRACAFCVFMKVIPKFPKRRQNESLAQATGSGGVSASAVICRTAATIREIPVSAVRSRA
jgi:hypothetical protein